MTIMKYLVETELIGPLFSWADNVECKENVNNSNIALREQNRTGLVRYGCHLELGLLV